MSFYFNDVNQGIQTAQAMSEQDARQREGDYRRKRAGIAPRAAVKPTTNAATGGQYPVHNLPPDPAIAQKAAAAEAQVQAKAAKAAEDAAYAVPPPKAGLEMPSQVGRMGGPVRQISPDSTRPGQIWDSAVAGGDAAQAITRMRTRTATGGYEGIPATSPLARGWAWLTKAANDPYHAEQASARAMADWVQEPEFAALIRNDTNRITEFNADPLTFYKKYSTSSITTPPLTGTPSAGLTTAQTAAIESNNDPNATNPNSSARGLYQFLDDTWANTVKKYGKAAGVTLADRGDPTKEALMANALREEIRAELTTFNGGRVPNKYEEYGAWFLGAPDFKKATRAATKDDSQIASAVLPAAAAANPNVFNNPDGSPRTLAELEVEMTRRVDAKLGAGVQVASAPVGTTIKDNTGATRKVPGAVGMKPKSSEDATKDIMDKPTAKVKTKSRMPRGGGEAQLAHIDDALNFLIQQENDMRASGLGGKADLVAVQRMMMETTKFYASSDVAAVNAEAGDMGLAELLYSQWEGRRIEFGPTDDANKYLIYEDGQPTDRIVTRGDIAGHILKTSKVTYAEGIRNAQAGAAAKTDEAVLESMLAIRKAYVEGNYKILQEEAKNSGLYKGIEDGESHLVWQPISQGAGNAAYKL